MEIQFFVNRIRTSIETETYFKANQMGNQQSKELSLEVVLRVRPAREKMLNRCTDGVREDDVINCEEGYLFSSCLSSFSLFLPLFFFLTLRQISERDRAFARFSLEYRRARVSRFLFDRIQASRGIRKEREREMERKGRRRRREKGNAEVFKLSDRGGEKEKGRFLFVLR